MVRDDVNLLTRGEFPLAGAILRLQDDVRASGAFALREEWAHHCRIC